MHGDWHRAVNHRLWFVLHDSFASLASRVVVEVAANQCRVSALPGRWVDRHLLIG